jgi:hypothetical protein
MLYLKNNTYYCSMKTATIQIQLPQLIYQR